MVERACAKYMGQLFYPPHEKNNKTCKITIKNNKGTFFHHL